MHRVLALPALLVALASPALAQSQPVIDRAEQGTPTRPAPDADAADAARGRATDEDAGVQRVARPRTLPFKLSATLDEQLYVTDNVFLSPDDSADSGESATLLASTFLLRVEGLPAVVGHGLLTPSVGFLYQRYLHGLSTDDPTIEELDFDSFGLPLSVSYRFGQGWEAHAGLAIGALYSVRGDPSYELLYRTHTGSLGLRKVAKLRKNTLLIAGGALQYADTWTSLREVPATLGYRDDRNDKLNYALDVSLHHFVDAWSFSSSVNLSYADYLHWQEGGFADFDRADLTLGVGLGASYAFNTWGSLRLFAGYALRESSLDDYDYDAGTLGCGLTLTLRY